MNSYNHRGQDDPSPMQLGCGCLGFIVVMLIIGLSQGDMAGAIGGIIIVAIGVTAVAAMAVYNHFKEK